ncbi:GNAT family N-acetyltransferase [Amycolatopsis jejuensis]|uniref:GNAT family N-acetyltransferase n=1 Tax=Amycolatopsis jejuensis TaxID=330084 RepID=UPI0024811EB0|nr:GNAT family N-acetyltransferase [Amycolatopsis jejuensis]
MDSRTDFWASRLADPSAQHTVLVSTDPAGLITGFAAFGPSRDEDGAGAVAGAGLTGELASLYLLPSHWGRGTGRILHERCVELLSERFREATLWVLSTNARARRFYERAGWIADGTTKVEALSTVTLEEVRYRLALRG